MKMMKSLVLVLSLVIPGVLRCQNPTANGYFLKLIYGDGTHLIYGASFTHVNKKGFSLTGQYIIERRDSESLPDDYKAGGFPFPFVPRVFITTTNILIGKVVEAEGTNLIQYEFRGGLNYGVIERPVNFERNVKRGGVWFDFSSNYTNEWDRKKFIGLVLNPIVNFNFTRIVGLSIGARANINHQDITWGFEAGLTIGCLRGKRTK